jgi:hypothetical protein
MPQGASSKFVSTSKFVPILGHKMTNSQCDFCFGKRTLGCSNFVVCAERDMVTEFIMETLMVMRKSVIKYLNDYSNRE